MKVLKDNVIVPSMRIVTTKLTFLILKRKGKKKTQTKQQLTPATTPTSQNLLKMILILKPDCNIKIWHIIQLVLIINLILFKEKINNTQHHHRNFPNHTMPKGIISSSIMYCVRYSRCNDYVYEKNIGCNDVSLHVEF